MDPLHHHHHAPLHWGYSAAHPQHNTWIPPPTTPITSHHTASATSSTTPRKLKRTISESDCEDIYSEESSKEQTSPGESDSCHMMSRKKRRGVIEKKRRDRINLSLTELKRLVPSAYEKQGSAKLEKAEILQLTVDHLKSMHGKGPDGMSFDPQRFAVEYHIVGFRECASEVARYLVTMEGMDIQDPLRLRLMSHLQCFVAQREHQLKSSNGAVGPSGPLSPSAQSVSPSVVNPVSPNHIMNQSTTPLTPPTNSHANWMASPSSYHHQQGYQMMPTTYQQHQNAYACQTATAQSGYVPNLPPPLPHQYDQYGNTTSTTTTSNQSIHLHSLHGDPRPGASSSTGQGDESTNSYSTDSASRRTGMTTRSQASNNNNNTSNNTRSASSSSNDVNVGQGGNNGGGGGGESGVGPTYTDLSSVSVIASVSAATSMSSAVASVSMSSSASALSGGHNRLHNNYNHYSPSAMDSFGGHYHLAAATTGSHTGIGGYNLHGGLQSDPSRGYNVSPANGNSKPYRPWGAEMAY